MAVVDRPQPVTADAPRPFWRSLLTIRGGAGARRTARVPWIPIVIISVIVIMAVFAPVLAPYSPIDQTLRDKLLPPAWMEGGKAKYFLGTDHFGRDMLSRLIHGARVSMVVGIVVIALGVLVGVALGLVAGFFGGIVDIAIMRAMDTLLRIYFKFSQVRADLGAGAR